MKKFGVIEGFYGKLMSFEDRHKILESFSKNQLNYYLYAPKEDPFLRHNFELEPFDEWSEQFKKFLDDAHSKSVDIEVGVSPSLESHTSFIQKKIEFFLNLGCRRFSFLFDDLAEFDLNSQIKIVQEFKSKYPHVNFSFCPTVYCTELSTQDDSYKKYFQDFCQSFPRDIEFYWTGEKVISTKLEMKSEALLENFPTENIAVWDNYFTIDSCPQLLNLTNMAHIDRSYFDKKIKFLINLTGLPRTDLLLVDVFNNYLNDSNSFSNILNEHGLDEYLIKNIDWFNPDLKNKLSRKDQEKIEKIMLSWFHPLKNEWYPYLHTLKNWGKK